MAVDIATYRARVGLFNRSKMVSVKTTSFFAVLISTSIILFLIVALHCLLSIAGDIELNPGSPVTVWHCNVRGLNQGKMQALVTDIQGKFDILGITETLLTAASKTNLNLQGYHPIFRKDRSQGNELGGGVALYVSEMLAACRKQQFELPNIETLCVEIVIKHTKVLVCVCYRPPRGYFLGRPSGHIRFHTAYGL